MSYLIAHNYSPLQKYKTEAAAKAAFTRRWSKLFPEAKIYETTYFYTRVDHPVKVRSLMSGKMVELKASQVGTCIDPSTELYWSM
jgi:hypothetical protein